MTDYISVDVESSGPLHGYNNLLEIGAVDCDNLSKTFQIYIQPINDNWSDSARMVNKSQQFYLDKGIPEYTAMLRFKLWLEKFNKPVFVGFNAPFDYGWINYEFHKMCGENPFGINALDIKAMWYGYKGGSGNKIEWRETTKKHIKHEIKLTHKHTHQALEDAIEQAELFNEIRRLFP